MGNGEIPFLSENVVRRSVPGSCPVHTCERYRVVNHDTCVTLCVRMTYHGPLIHL